MHLLATSDTTPPSCSLNVESCGIPFLYIGLLDTFGVGETCLDASSSTVKGLKKGGRIPPRSFTNASLSLLVSFALSIPQYGVWIMNISNMKKRSGCNSMWSSNSSVSSHIFLAKDSLAETAAGAAGAYHWQIHQGLNMAHKQQFPALEFSHLLASNFGRTLKMGTSQKLWTKLLLISQKKWETETIYPRGYFTHAYLSIRLSEISSFFNLQIANCQVRQL